MDAQTYNLLTTVLGALIPGSFGIINTIIKLRAKRREKVVIERTNGEKSKPTKPISQKGRSHMLLLVVLIGVFTVIGFYIGNATKESPSIVKHYNREERISISNERIGEIDHQIHEIEKEKVHIMEQPMLPELERDENIQSLDERINQLKMEKAEYEEIEGQENKEVRIQRLQNEIELFNDRQSEVESKINHLMPQRETNPDVQSEIEELKVKIGLIQQEREDMERELGRLLERQ